MPTMIDEPLLAEATRRIVDRFDPEKLILFGSRARGDAREDSDYDIMIVAPSPLKRWERTPPVYNALVDLDLNAEVVWWTAEEIDEWSEVRRHLVTRATREGVVLYEKDSA